jgi:hypothetical protein
LEEFVTQVVACVLVFGEEEGRSWLFLKLIDLFGRSRFSIGILLRMRGDKYRKRGK